MIFIDSNIPMYLVGAAHPNKLRAIRLLERVARARERLVTDTEVFQEILHRYTAIRRRDAIEPAWEALEGLVDETFSIRPEDVGAAKDLVLRREPLSARDALHIAVMRHREVDEILTFDTGFDGMDGLRRID